MILITGATGFVGTALIRRLAQEQEFTLRAAVRRGAGEFLGTVRCVEVTDLSAETAWGHALIGAQIVIHAAARVHVLREFAVDPLTEYRRTNVEGTLNLARQAASAGVRRFVFISSIKVNGETTELGRPFSADDRPCPTDPYGISKMEAEQGLRNICEATGMEFVVIRPPLVYGPHVKANFRSLLEWLWRGVPLPLGAIRNRRSLVALDNLVDLIITSVGHAAAANQTLLVSDDEDLSTTELLRRLAHALGRRARLISMPTSLVKFGTRLAGRADVGQRLCGSLYVDIAKTRGLLGWAPVVTVEQALKKTADAFLLEVR